MRVAIIQSNYIPWRGYFDIIHDVDLFIFYDDVQFTKNDWRNRNRIKTSTGIKWLSVPVGQSTSRIISDVVVIDALWQKKHWKTLQQNYQKAACFALYKDFFEDFYCGKVWTNLSELNQYLIKNIVNFLDIDVQFKNSCEYTPEGSKLYRVLDILKKANASVYVSGSSAKNYIQNEFFAEIGVGLEYKVYDYQNYPQLFGNFDGSLSILDLLFNLGEDAKFYINSLTPNEIAVHSKKLDQ